MNCLVIQATTWSDALAGSVALPGTMRTGRLCTNVPTYSSDLSETRNDVRPHEPLLCQLHINILRVRIASPRLERDS